MHAKLYEHVSLKRNGDNDKVDETCKLHDLCVI